MRLSSGDTSVTIEGTRRKDEVGILARALEHFRLSIAAEVETRRLSRVENAGEMILRRLHEPEYAPIPDNPTATDAIRKRLAELARPQDPPAQAQPLPSSPRANRDSTDSEVRTLGAATAPASAREKAAGTRTRAKSVKH